MSNIKGYLMACVVCNQAPASTYCGHVNCEGDRYLAGYCPEHSYAAWDPKPNGCVKHYTKDRMAGEIVTFGAWWESSPDYSMDDEILQRTP